MTERLFHILWRRYSQSDPNKPWVFWHTYWSSRTRKKCQGPYGRRKKLLKGLCKKAGVRYFEFHALRHSSASIMDNANFPVGTIQKILGHSQRRSTEIYLHTLGEAERQAMAVFERTIEKSLTRWGVSA